MSEGEMNLSWGWGWVGGALIKFLSLFFPSTLRFVLEILRGHKRQAGIV